MLATSSELQTLAPQLDDLEQVRLLRHRVAGEPFPHSFIHEADAYSATPADLIRGRDHAPGTDQGKGKGMAWYFCSPANYDHSAGGGSARRRRRQVDGGGAGAGAGKTCWHPEKGKQPILGPDKKSVGAYKHTLSFVSKIKTPPGTAKPFRNKRLGWCMIEIGLEQQDDGADQQLVLCKVYRSRQTDPETSTEASPAVAEDVGLTAIRIALLRMIDDLGLHRSIVSGSLDELEQVLKGIGMMKELTTRIFSAYLNKLGKGARQQVKPAKEMVKMHIKFQKWESYDVSNFGRGSSDLATTTIGRDLGSKEIQVWKDVDGVFTCDRNVCANAIPLSYLTFDEAAELGFFDALSMKPAMEGGIPVIVKNCCNPQAPGTMITKTKDLSKCVLTSIVLKSNISVLNIESTRMLDQSLFLTMSFSIFGNLGIPVDRVAISEGKISVIVVPSKLPSCELVQLELDNVVEELQKFAVVHLLQDRSVISLIGNAQMSPLILEKASNVLRSIDVKVQMILQGLLSEVMKVSLVVDDSEAEDCVRALHSAFFENGFVSEVDGAENGCPIPGNSSAAAASSGVKRKAAEGHPESPPSVRQERMGTEPSVLQETERTSLSGTDPMPVGDSYDKVGDPSEFFQSILNDVEMEPVRGDDGGDWTRGLAASLQVLAEVAEDGSGPRNALDEMLRNLFSENDPMPVGGDDGGDLARYLAGIVEGDDNLDDRGDLPTSTTMGICPSESAAA